MVPLRASAAAVRARRPMDRASAFLNVKRLQFQAGRGRVNRRDRARERLIRCERPVGPDRHRDAFPRHDFSVGRGARKDPEDQRSELRAVGRCSLHLAWRIPSVSPAGSGAGGAQSVAATGPEPAGVTWAPAGCCWMAKRTRTRIGASMSGPPSWLYRSNCVTALLTESVESRRRDRSTCPVVSAP